jgi:hypothetical protein
MCNGDLMADAIHHNWDSPCDQVEFFVAVGVFDAPCESEEMDEARADCCQGCNSFSKKTGFFYISQFCRTQKVSSKRRKDTSTNVGMDNTF